MTSCWEVFKREDYKFSIESIFEKLKVPYRPSSISILIGVITAISTPRILFIPEEFQLSELIWIYSTAIEVLVCILEAREIRDKTIEKFSAIKRLISDKDAVRRMRD